MPVEVSISRYDDKMVEQAISLEEWEDCVKEIEDIKLVKNDDGSFKLEGASYFYFFAGIMFATAVLFITVTIFYKTKEYMQAEKQ